MICRMCGTEFTGNFCPECGAKRDVLTAKPNAEAGSAAARIVTSASTSKIEKGLISESETRNLTACERSAGDPNAEKPQEEEMRSGNAGAYRETENCGDINEGDAFLDRLREEVTAHGAAIAKTASDAAIAAIAKTASDAAIAAIVETAADGAITSDNGTLRDAGAKPGKTAVAERMKKAVAKLAAVLKTCDKSGNVMKLARWLPAGCTLLYALFLWIFMASPAVTVMGIESISLFGMTGAGGLGAFAAVILIFITLGFTAAGGLKLYLAIRYPYYQNKPLNIAQNAMLFLAFVFSAIAISAGNGMLTEAGSAAKLILSFTILGAIVYSMAVIAIKYGVYPPVDEKKAAAKELFDRDVAALKARWAEKKKNNVESAAERVTRNADRKSSFGAGAEAANGADCEIAVVRPSAAATPDEINATVFKSRILSYRTRPAVWSIIMSVVLFGLLTLSNFDMFINATVPESLVQMIVIPYISAAVFAVLGIYRAFKSYSDPFEKHPVVLLLQSFCFLIAAMYPVFSFFEIVLGTARVATGFVAAVLTIYTAAVYGGCSISYGLSANTYQNAAKIRAARADYQRNGNRKMPAKSIALMSIALVAILAMTIVPPVVGAADPWKTAKVDRIELGGSYSDVIALMDEPAVGGSREGYAMWYGNNYKSVLNEIDKLSGVSGDVGSFEDLGNALEQAAKNAEKIAQLKEKLKTMEHKELRVGLIDYKVALVVLDTAAVDESAVPIEEKRVKNVALDYVTENGAQRLTYRFEFEDGSLEKGYVNFYTIEDGKIKWSGVLAKNQTAEKPSGFFVPNEETETE